jgi:hypothetical protein
MHKREYGNGGQYKSGQVTMVVKSAQGSTSGRRLRSDSLETSKAMYVLPFHSRPPAGLLELERGQGHSSLGTQDVHGRVLEGSCCIPLWRKRRCSRVS